MREYVISVFFFSSRRRHTRFDCDWSSDVCSSDLVHRFGLREEAVQEVVDPEVVLLLEARVRDAFHHRELLVRMRQAEEELEQVVRSEERRVGKEGRSRWAPDH